MRHDLDRLLKDLDDHKIWSQGDFDHKQRWSYGDVENNGIFYHPNLTHYAHQVFEEVFFKECGLLYVDLSGKEPNHEKARQSHEPPLERMTFPVQWLHQWMGKPMRAGEILKTWIDAVAVADKRVGVRAWVYDEDNELAALVIWLRWAVILDPEPHPIAIPAWFPLRGGTS